MRRLSSNIYFIVIALLALVLAFIWFKDGLILGTAESSLPFYDLAYHFNFTRYAWVDAWLGNSTGVITASAPTYFFWSWLESLGIPNFLIEAGTLWALFSLAGIFIFLLTRKLFPSVKPKYLLIGVLFYWFNPLSSVNVWTRFLYNHMFLWALLPAAIYLYIKGLKDGDLRYSLLSAASTIIFSYALTSIAFVMILLGLYFFIFFCFLLLKERKRFSLIYFFITVFTFLLLNSWWLSQLVGSGISSYQEIISRFFTPLGNLNSLTSVSLRLGQLEYVYRFLHKSLVEEGQPWLSMFDNTILRGLQFLVTGVVLWAIYKFRHRFGVVVFGSIFIFSLFLMKGNAPPVGEIFEVMFIKFPFLQVFRNPVEKLSFVVSLTAAPLLALGLAQVEKYLNRDRRTIFYLAVFGYTLFILGYPFWTGRVFSGPKDFSKRETQSYQVDVPEYYQEAQDWLKDNSQDERIVVLPLGDEGITQSWQYPYQGVEISNVLFDREGISHNTTIPFYNALVSELSKYQLSENILDFFPFVDAKYLILRRDINNQVRRMADPAVVGEKVSEWIQNGLVSEVEKFGELTIYQIEQGYEWDKFYLTPNVLISNERDFSKLSNFSPSFPEIKLAVIDLKDEVVGEFPDSSVVVKAKKIFTPLTNQIPDDFSDSDLLGRLFYAEHLPNRWFYPIIRAKEILFTPAKKDYSGYMLYKTGLLGKRAAEIYKLKREGISGRVVTKAEDSYESEFEKIKQDLRITMVEDLPEAEVIRNSLIYQMVLFLRVDTPLYSRLFDFLVDERVIPRFALPKAEHDKYLVYQFEIDKEGIYKFEIDLGPEGELFLDGNEVEVQGGSISFNLKMGIHEVALLGKEDDLFSKMVDENYLRSNENLPYLIEIDLPETPGEYILEFEYRLIYGDSFDLLFLQDIDSTDNPVFKQQIVKDRLFHDWKHYEKKMASSPGAKSAKFIIRPSQKRVCERTYILFLRCNFLEDKFNTEFRNFTIRKVNLPAAHLTASPRDIQISQESKVEWEKVSPVEYKVKVIKYDSVKEVLVFSELYNPGWILSDTLNGARNNNHLLANFYANGWILDKEQESQYLLTFAPQKQLNNGVKVSVVAAIATLLVVCFLTWKKIKA